MAVLKSFARRWSGWITAALVLGVSGSVLAEPQTTTKSSTNTAVVAKAVVAKESFQSVNAAKSDPQKNVQSPVTTKTAVKEPAKLAVLAQKATKEPSKPAHAAQTATKEVARPAKVSPQADEASAKPAKRLVQGPDQGATTSNQVTQQVRPQSKQLALPQASAQQEQESVMPSAQQSPTKKPVATQTAASQSSKNEASLVLGSSENPIKVGLLQLSPFVIKRQGRYSGLVVAFWEKIASRYGWHYQFVDAGKNYGKAVEAVADGRYDIVLGNFSTTYERSKLVDFSRPFLLNYASVLTKPEIRNVFWTILKVVKMILPVLFFLLTALCCITLVFFFTRDLTDERGLLANAFCAVMALMRMGGYVQKPSALLSRVVVMILAFFSVFFMATFSAVMTDALLLVEQPQDPFVVLSDLKGKTFIVAQGSSFVDVVRGYDANVVEIPDAEYAGRYYFANRSKYDGFVGDQALVHELARQLSSRDIIQSGINLRNDELVFLFNKRFPHKELVDEGILRLQDKNISMLICAHYLGIDSKLCVL